MLATLQGAGAATIITIFGCGGDRDREKRPVMGKVAAQYSSLVILTTDNARSEDPVTIIREIEKGVLEQGFFLQPPGVPKKNAENVVWIIEDRRTAICRGIAYARKGDVVLIAGKGHETWQDIGGQKQHFDDREEAVMALQKCA